MRDFVVVPDGLEPRTEPQLPVPAVPYRRSLEYALMRASEIKGTIYLAPANKFGYAITEQESARRFLIENGFDEQLIECCPSRGTSYLDTRENARQLRVYLEEKWLWPLPEICLIATEAHLHRARYLFEATGFNVSEAVGTVYASEGHHRFVPRLWYYKYPAAHQVYEKIAFIRDSIRGE